MGDNSANITQLLYDAALQDDVTLLQDLLRRDPFLPYRPPLSPYTTSPWHVACKLGHLHFIAELFLQNPCLTEELDPKNKSSPLHVASRNSHSELVKFLVSVNPSMCFARDMLGMTPVHVAAMKGHVDVLDELLSVAPVAARERVGPAVGSGGGDTILHLCVKHNQFEALKKVAEKVGDAQMLNAVNGDGNTILHEAVANKQLEIVRFLLSDERLEKSMSNSNGLTALDISKEGHGHEDIDNDSLPMRLTLKEAGALSSDEINRKPETERFLNWFQNQSNILMVVASLIATMAYQAGLNPPGGVRQDGGTQQSNSAANFVGKAIMAQQNKGAYHMFLILNSSGFIISIICILMLVADLPTWRLLLFSVKAFLSWAMFSTIVAYAIALHFLTPKEIWYSKPSFGYGLKIAAIVIGLSILGMATQAVWRIRISPKCHERVGRKP